MEPIRLTGEPENAVAQLIAHLKAQGIPMNNCHVCRKDCGDEVWFRGADFWARYTDFAQFPHLNRFADVRELFHKLDNLDVVANSQKMREFSDVLFAKSKKQWEAVVAGLLRAL